MSHEIVVPELETAAEITLAAWLKQPGDHVEQGEVIAEVLTEKVNVEIQAPSSGLIEALLVDEGEVVEVGQAIARLAAN
jgi:2-oxoglutarate dehydrogenase E2 component (dihydrolipoamide succinyltransferase)